MNDVDSAVTSNKLRTITKSRKFLSSAKSRQVSCHQVLFGSSLSPSLVGSTIPRKIKTAATHDSAATKMSPATIGLVTLSRMIHNTAPTIIAATPPNIAARPLICPRCPFGIVRPWTSFEAIEHSARAVAKPASARMTATPSATLSRNNVARPISAAATACPNAPAIQTVVRRDRDFTHGVSAACGSIEPDSRTGTSMAMKKPGAPAECSNHGNNVFAATI